LKRSYWKKSWFIGLVVTVLFLLAAAADLLRSPDLTVYDWAVRLAPERKANPDVVVVAIDDAALLQMGSWPWPRDIMAQLTAEIVAARPGVIGYALSFDSRQSSRSLESLDKFRASLGKAKNKAKVKRLLQQVEAGLDTDQAFANSLARAGRVVMAVPYQLHDSSTPGLQQEASEAIARYGIQNIKDKTAAKRSWFAHEPVPVAGVIFPPIQELLRYAGALGHLRLNAPLGTSVRQAPLVLRHGEVYLPSFALMMAARSRGLSTRHLRLVLHESIRLSGFNLIADKQLQIHPTYYAGHKGQSAFPVYSVLDVLNKTIPEGALRKKTILIGLTARQHVNYVQTPIGQALAPVMAAAHQVSSLLNGDLYHTPQQAGWIELVTILAMGLYLMFILPRLRLGTGLAFSALLLFVVLNTQIVLMMAKATWIPLMLPALSLVLGHLLLAVKRLFESSLGGMKAELAEANRSLGQSLQAQGQLDQAFEKYKLCLIDQQALALIYNLGLDYERKRQFNKASTVFRFISQHDRRYSDVSERIRQNEEMSNTLVLGAGKASAANGTLVPNQEGVQKPMLGRYQIDKELGRGAMGMVYLGHDPKIGRTVAIKTMMLAEEFEGEQLDEVRQRFFREAETAGRLNHPNIVTIYDVGEDQDLSYIAMDYVKGENLSAYCKRESLLPTDTVLKLIGKVAEALDYAHKENIVHRDIKPANIIYDKETGALKVTDFGVACLTDASKTKTGTILGSPSYMSPEQLAGKKVDGRSDLFSLGVTLYQMLTGELPFMAESLASLMYKISHEKHPDVKMFRPDVPPCVTKIVNKALHKDIERRFQTGEKFAESLQRCDARLSQAG